MAVRRCRAGPMSHEEDLEGVISHSATDPLQRPAYRGGFLGLLADPRTVALMEGLRDAPLDREQLVAQVGFDGSAFDRSMRRLTHMGLVVAMVVPDDRRRREYQLARCGRDLLVIDAELERAMAGIAAQGDDLKTLAARTVSDSWDRAVTRVVLEAPQPFGELLRTARGTWQPDTERRHSRLSAATLTMRLARLQRLGLIDHQPAPPQGAALYRPGEEIWRLGRVAALSALWRWDWTPDCVPRMAGDLSGLVRMLAPRVRAIEAPQIRVVLHVIAPPTMDPWPHVVVCLSDGRMSLPELTLTDPDAHARATPRVWLESLLGGELDAITVEGEATAAHAVIAGLAGVLRPGTAGLGANETVQNKSPQIARKKTYVTYPSGRG